MSADVVRLGAFFPFQNATHIGERKCLKRGHPLSHSVSIFQTVVIVYSPPSAATTVHGRFAPHHIVGLVSSDDLNLIYLHARELAVAVCVGWVGWWVSGWVEVSTPRHVGADYGKVEDRFPFFHSKVFTFSGGIFYGLKK